MNSLATNRPSATIAFVTLGCKLNYAETATLERAFLERGFTCVPATAPAAVYVVNTCSVTEHSDKKCRQVIRKLHKLNPQAYIAVTGCYAQLKSREVAAIEGVALVVGAQYKGQLVERVCAAVAPAAALPAEGSAARYTTPCEQIAAFFPAYSGAAGNVERTRSFLKVQDGCDYRCSYCTVPQARGGSRNISIAQAVAQAHEIAAGGVKEIVLTGVNTGDFGKTTGEGFFDLLKALAEVEGIARYRISSIEPNLLTPQMIDWMAEHPRFMPHFHIPLQSGCNSVLARMRRRYTTELFASRVAHIKSRMPRAFIGIDVIVGFVGETAEEFETTYRFLEELAPAFLHVFPYSVRPGTPAAQLPVAQRVSEAEKTLRARRLGQLSTLLHEQFADAQKGTREWVLFESRDVHGQMQGYTRNYLRVTRPYDPALINQIVEVLL